MWRSRRRHLRSCERGATAVFVALTLLVIAGFLALAINVGHLYSVRGELQNGSDSGALAGAIDLNGMVAGLNPALTSAGQFAGYHQTDSHVQVVGSPIELGHWPLPSENNTCGPGEAPTGTAKPPDYHLFCRVDARDSAAALRINAVRVQTSRAAGVPGGGAAPVFMNGLLGAASTSDVGTEAVALTGGPCQSQSVCLPIVVGLNCLTDPSGGLACPAGGGVDSLGPKYLIGMESTSMRSAGWSVFTSANPSKSQVCSFLRQSICPSLGAQVQPVDTSQGNMLNGACKEGTKKTTCDWVAAYVGSTVDVPLISFSGSLTEPCPSFYNHDAWVVGFATVSVLTVNCNSGCYGVGCNDATNPCSQFASSDCAEVQLVCNHKSGPAPTGCVWSGTSSFRPVLVR